MVEFNDQENFSPLPWITIQLSAFDLCLATSCIDKLGTSASVFHCALSSFRSDVKAISRDQIDRLDLSLWTYEKASVEWCLYL